MSRPKPPLDDGDLFVTYSLQANPKEVEELALEVCVEQTVEVTRPLWADPEVAGRTVATVERISPIGRNRFEVLIRFPAATVSSEVPQVFSVVFGNISLKRGIRVERIWPGPSLARALGGPRYGVEGLRDLCKADHRPLVASALKPLGRPVETLARFAYQMALGGLDIVKDDHGLSDQKLCPFEKRVQACAEAVALGAAKSRKPCLYFPNVTGPSDEILPRALFAKACGASGLLISPLVTGLDCLRLLRDRVGLPIMAHPALSGAFFAHPAHGIAPSALLGTLMRMSGADMVIFPSWVGRFPMRRQTCASIDRALKEDLQGLRRAFPVLAGGMSLDSVREMRKVHGDDVVFLVGSALYERSPDLVENARYFRSIVES